MLCRMPHRPGAAAEAEEHERIEQIERADGEAAVEDRARDRERVQRRVILPHRIRMSRCASPSSHSLPSSLLASCSSPSAPSPTPLTISLQSSAWQTISEPQPFPLANDGGALTFQFPDSGSINYLFTPSPLTIVHGTLSVSVRVTTSGPVVFNSLDPQMTSSHDSVIGAAVHLGQQQRQRRLRSLVVESARFTLAAGTGTITVPLTADAWSSVNGRFGNADRRRSSPSTRRCSMCRASA